MTGGLYEPEEGERCELCGNRYRGHPYDVPPLVPIVLSLAWLGTSAGSGGC